MLALINVSLPSMLKAGLSSSMRRSAYDVAPNKGSAALLYPVYLVYQRVEDPLLLRFEHSHIQLRTIYNGFALFNRRINFWHLYLKQRTPLIILAQPHNCHVWCALNLYCFTTEAVALKRIGYF